MIARTGKARMSATLAAVMLALAVSSVGSQSASAAGGHVLPSRARPHGYSLADLTRLSGAFTAGNSQDLDLIPETPFQILYRDIATEGFQFSNGGVLVTGSNVFTVKPGTQFFVPIQSATDGPPVAGVYPSDEKAAAHYFFDPSQLGARDYEIVVDGVTTPVGPDHLAGPVTTPLPDGGTHIITLGVFLTPMTPGTHTVTISGGLFGQAIAPAIGLTFLAEKFTYTVKVVARSSRPQQRNTGS
jgi:hypothetical protein